MTSTHLKDNTLESVVVNNSVPYKTVLKALWVVSHSFPHMLLFVLFSKYRDNPLLVGDCHSDTMKTFIDIQ